MKIWHEVWDYVKMIIIVVAIVLVINNVVLINAKIPSESMEKTIMTGDRIFGFRLAYGINIDFFGHNYTKKFRDPERFDIVIFKYPDDKRKLCAQRDAANQQIPQSFHQPPNDSAALRTAETFWLKNWNTVRGGGGSAQTGRSSGQTIPIQRREKIQEYLGRYLK